MTISEYQKKWDEILQGYEKPYWDPLSQLARLTEEVGEVSRILNHKYGDKPKKNEEEHDELADELADVIHTAVLIANREGIDLEKHLTALYDKLLVRDKDRFIKKS